MNAGYIFKKIFIGLILFSMVIPAKNASATELTSYKKESIDIKSEVPPKEIVKGNTKYYINGQGVITLAKVFSGSKVSKILNFHPNSNLDNAQKSIKYIFYLNSDGSIGRAEQLDKKTQKVTNRYEYYPKTFYGNHGDKIKYIFDVNSSGYLTRAVKRENGTNQIISRYEYFPKTVYGKHSKNIKYIFTINTSGYVTKATQRKKGTMNMISTYEFYPKTVYGKQFSRVSGIKLNVPLINQRPELPTGCEITAVTMMLQYKGVHVDKVTLANKMPKHSQNPNLGYVGNPYTKKGWTIYPSALMGLVKNYAGSAKNLTGTSNVNIEKQLVSNKSIVVWVSRMHGFSVHALVLTGFDKNYYYYNDCWTGEKNAKLSKKEFNRLWANQSKRAISY
ncbi:C39 family peptidase [Neobacillus drentensis]|uniref:C39 family peptidase n=1 Tax=Neobacillus drentensis TaxID=220684 RepID=UPI000AC10186|nr:C39 family peptidase [Neobacillus drentensis]